MQPVFTQEQLQNIINLIPACIYWMSVEGNLLGCNNALLDLFGKKSLEEILGLTPHVLFGETQKNIADNLRNTNLYVMENREVVVIEEVVPNIKGEQITFISKKTPLIGTNKQLCGILGVSIDIGVNSKAIRRDILDKSLEIMPSIIS